MRQPKNFNRHSSDAPAKTQPDEAKPEAPEVAPAVPFQLPAVDSAVPPAESVEPEAPPPTEIQIMAEKLAEADALTQILKAHYFELATALDAPTKQRSLKDVHEKTMAEATKGRCVVLTLEKVMIVLRNVRAELSLGTAAGLTRAKVAVEACIAQCALVDNPPRNDGASGRN